MSLSASVCEAMHASDKELIPGADPLKVDVVLDLPSPPAEMQNASEGTQLFLQAHPGEHIAKQVSALPAVPQSPAIVPSATDGEMQNASEGSDTYCKLLFLQANPGTIRAHSAPPQSTTQSTISSSAPDGEMQTASEETRTFGQQSFLQANPMHGAAQQTRPPSDVSSTVTVVELQDQMEGADAVEDAYCQLVFLQADPGTIKAEQAPPLPAATLSATNLQQQNVSEPFLQADPTAVTEEQFPPSPPVEHFLQADPKAATEEQFPPSPPVSKPATDFSPQTQATSEGREMQDASEGQLFLQAMPFTLSQTAGLAQPGSQAGVATDQELQARLKTERRFFEQTVHETLSAHIQTLSAFVDSEVRKVRDNMSKLSSSWDERFRQYQDKAIKDEGLTPEISQFANQMTVFAGTFEDRLKITEASQAQWEEQRQKFEASVSEMEEQRQKLEASVREMQTEIFGAETDVGFREVAYQMGIFAEEFGERLRYTEASQVLLEEKGQKLETSVADMKVEVFGAESDVGFKRGLQQKLNDLADAAPTIPLEQRLAGQTQQVTAFIEDAYGELNRKIVAMEKQHEEQSVVKSEQERLTMLLRAETLARQDQLKQLKSKTDSLQQDVTQMSRMLQDQSKQLQNNKETLQQTSHQMNEMMPTLQGHVKRIDSQIFTHFSTFHASLKQVQTQMRGMDALRTSLKHVQDELGSKNDMARIKEACHTLGLIERLEVLEQWKKICVMAV